MALIVKNEKFDTYLAVRRTTTREGGVTVIAQKFDDGDVSKLFLGIDDVKALHAALGAILADA